MRVGLILTLRPDFSCSSTGLSFGAIFSDLTLWHCHVRHMSRPQLLRISGSGAVEGFSMKGVRFLSQNCDTCSIAKNNHQPDPHHSRFSDQATCVSQTVSTDTKTSVSFRSKVYRYIICYVDHYSRFELCYFTRSTKEVPTTPHRYFLVDTCHLGVTVCSIQSDRGSEFFPQKGDNLADCDGCIHLFDAICASQLHPVKHILRSVE